MRGLKYKAPERTAQILTELHPDRRFNLLDLGCGTGLLGVYLGPINGFIIGVDLSARMIEQAGADALELNGYYIATRNWETSDEVERRMLDILKSVKSAVKIPVSAKLSPFFSSIAHMCKQLCEAGADGVVLFNRFYQPDIDVEELEVKHHLELSTSDELLLRLRWLAVLSGQLRCSLAATGGVHTATDALKAVMAGAHAVQVVSCILKHGPSRLTVLRDGLAAWLEEHDYTSLEQALGSMSLAKCPNPNAFERANYMRILSGWRA